MLARKLIIAATVASTIAVGLPSAASAHDGWRGHRHDRHHHRPRNCKSSGTTGTILGAVGGALVGRAIDTRGERATGTIVGAGAGALLGREIGRNRRC
jgi:tetrahydromethanopterin S-methyltransferase subunit D